MTNHNGNTVVPVFQLGIEIVPDGNLEGFRTRLEQLIKEGMPEEVLGVRAVHTGYDPVGYEKVGRDISAHIVLRDIGVLPDTGQEYHNQALQDMEIISEYGECDQHMVAIDQYNGTLYSPSGVLIASEQAYEAMREAIWVMGGSTHKTNISQDTHPTVKVHEYVVGGTDQDIRIMVTILDTSLEVASR